MIEIFRRRRELRCQQAVELITDYLDQALPAAQSRRLEAHLARCPHCARYLAQLRATIEATGQLRADPIQPADRRNLLRLYRKTIG